ncbi:MAG: hypothetical protein GY769_22775 [bacterium]|nr:hypothetical protein [bacterium]
MEGDWVACLDWEAVVAGWSSSGLRLRPRGGFRSDATTATRGELRLILAGALELAGARRSRAEELLESYQGRGESLFASLRGRFAALIWDGAERRLTALRDPMGIYPLFYSRAGNETLLSPSIEMLLDLAGVSRSVDRVALAEHLWHRWPDKRQTYFEAVRRIPAGHALEVTEDTEKLVRYWDPASAGDPDRVDWLDPEELAQFPVLFDRAIRRNAAAERSGVFLSGGLDSVAIASRLRDSGPKQKRPLALSLAFDHAECDELPIQSAVAATLDFEQEIQVVAARPGRRGPLERAADLASTWPVPLLNVWNGEFSRLAQAGRERGCDVILTGSGGDDWLGVSPYYAADLLLSGRLVTLARLIGGLRSSYGLSMAEAARIGIWRFGVRVVLRQAADGVLARLVPSASRWARQRRLRRGMPRWLAPDRGFRRELSERTGSLSSLRFGSSFYVREMRRGLDHPLVALELEESFELGRRFDVKLAHPFFDPDLVEFLYRVPPRLLIGDGGPDRKLVRRMLELRFPDLGFDSLRKSDARAFFGQLVRAEGRRLWQALGGARELGRLGILDPRAVEEEVGAMLDGGRSNTLFRFWDLVNLERWLRGQDS